MEPDFKNLYEAFQATVARKGESLAIKSEEEGVELTWNDVDKRVRAIAGGLNALGVARGDRVGMLLGARSEFIPIDLAAVSIGALPFSIYQTLAPDQIEYVVEDSGTRLIITEPAYLPNLLEARKNLPGLERVIVLGGEGGDMTMAELEAMDPDFDPAPLAAEVGLDDPLTLIYTSGTTGPPKGVLLTQGNLMSMLTTVMHSVLEIPETGRVISWLPAAHIAERGANYYTPVMHGLEVHVCPDPKRIIEFLPKVRPAWFFAVPRIWEKLKAGLESNLASLPDEQRKKAQAGLQAAIQKVRLEQAGEEVPEELAAGVAAADEALFSNLRVALGFDEALAVSAGAAPTPIEVLEFFHAIGIPVGELWGLSETCGVISINPPSKIKIGTVGPPVPGVEMRVAEDGELLCRSPFVMKEYRGKPEKTAETIVDGWLLTGDIGEIDEEGYITILDRKKELIINAAGKNMSPANIEAQIKVSSPLINQAVTVGDGRPYNVALIVLDPDFAPVWAGQNGIEGSFEDLAGDERIEAAIQAAVEEANSKLARVEQIKKFKLIPGEWLPGGDELTPTMKLKRKPIAEKYETEIEDLYS
ncbi:MAG: long-chain fatty acid--CoA ligase [Solirubrobacterales bacterium]|nr:long-chain fatty acid--CoA ligase [Solirubrobacterales bacterium]OJU95071.1 MAG: long-chain fatty acid--CoA ligase [Solirubrobacterales bacterium 67-14]